MLDQGYLSRLSGHNSSQPPNHSTFFSSPAQQVSRREDKSKKVARKKNGKYTPGKRDSRKSVSSKTRRRRRRRQTLRRGDTLFDNNEDKEETIIRQLGADFNRRLRNAHAMSSTTAPRLTTTTPPKDLTNSQDNITDTQHGVTDRRDFPQDVIVEGILANNSADEDFEYYTEISTPVQKEEKPIVSTENATSFTDVKTSVEEGANDGDGEEKTSYSSISADGIEFNTTDDKSSVANTLVLDENTIFDLAVDEDDDDDGDYDDYDDDDEEEVDETSTLLVLISAWAYRGSWLHNFDAAETVDAEFRTG
jgi:hypothetical protein